MLDLQNIVDLFELLRLGGSRLIGRIVRGRRFLLYKSFLIDLILRITLLRSKEHSHDETGQKDQSPLLQYTSQKASQIYYSFSSIHSYLHVEAPRARTQSFPNPGRNSPARK